MNRAALRLRLFSLKNGGRLSCFGNFGYSLALAAHVRVLFKRSGRCRIDRHLAPVDAPVDLRVQRTIARRPQAHPPLKVRNGPILRTRFAESAICIGTLYEAKSRPAFGGSVARTCRGAHPAERLTDNTTNAGRIAALGERPS